MPRDFCFDHAGCDDNTRVTTSDFIYRFGAVWLAYVNYAQFDVVLPSSLCSKSSDYSSISNAFWVLAAGSAMTGYLEGVYIEQALSGRIRPFSGGQGMRLPSSLAAMMVAASDPASSWASSA